MRKDLLASGQKSAKFAGGIGETDVCRNLSKEERVDDIAPLESNTKPKKFFRPLGTTILVRRQPIEGLSSILNTDMMEQEKPAEGIVVSVGNKVNDVIAGNQIVFGKYAGTEFKLNGEILLIMDISDVKGLIQDDLSSPVTSPQTENVWKYDYETRQFVPSLKTKLDVGGCIVGRT